MDQEDPGGSVRVLLRVTKVPNLLHKPDKSG